jgi:hypothetical protein
LDLALLTRDQATKRGFSTPFILHQGSAKALRQLVRESYVRGLMYGAVISL